MDFKLDIGELTNTINEDENIIKTLEEEKENINRTIAELTEAGWSGEAKDKFMEKHIKNQEFYTNLIEDIKYVKNALENEEKPRAVRLKKQSEDFVNCIKRSGGGTALTNDDTGIISLQYGGQFQINNNVSECIDNYKKMNSKFEEILNLANSLSFTSFPIADDVLNLQNSLKNQTTSLTEFNDSFNTYCNGVRDMEENICSVFSKISGITVGISEFRGVSAISENGQVDKNKVIQLMLKNPNDLTNGEKELLSYVEKVLSKDEYKKIKETVFTYEEAEKYIKCDILGLNVGLKTYFPNEISNLPKQITYEKDGYIYTYVLTENSPLTFNGVELPDDDIITKDGQVISNKLYGYKLFYTNEPKISAGTVFVSPTKGAGEAERVVNGKGNPYPKVEVEGHGEVPFPEGPYEPNNSSTLRPQFTDSYKKQFKEWWTGQGKPWPEGEVNIHHIKPLSKGGDNSFENLVPLVQPEEHQPFTNWWRSYPPKK
ncbi:HNH endonuclease signature motif containing protein [Clostridium kluyveri]|uniref:Uncharacterized protein n=1 Tax=Clostridium kluyveri TaxID=1534 RepID=A0A1L5F424_CLOKL|nr:HNH endonuclease signature motif containing protein [Clostridium kluyveri]APM37610.1 hypothetical protein BS101_02010 [Clostridium kluyveri]UZQ52377.1 hypothetical protein OP486_09545 [Clostridium kluyveri]